MKLYAYRRAGKIEFETCQMPPEAHVTDIGTIEVQEPEKEKKVESGTVEVGTEKVKLEIDNPPTLYDLVRTILDKLEDVRPAGGFEKTRKTVTKEAGWIRSPKLTDSGNQQFTIYVPADAKNIKCTYEVSE